MKFHHGAITVKDLLISIPFYGDLFGFKEIKRFIRDDMGELRTIAIGNMDMPILICQGGDGEI